MYTNHITHQVLYIHNFYKHSDEPVKDMETILKLDGFGVVNPTREDIAEDMLKRYRIWLNSLDESISEKDRMFEDYFNEKYKTAVAYADDETESTILYILIRYHTYVSVTSDDFNGVPVYKLGDPILMPPVNIQESIFTDYNNAEQCIEDARNFIGTKGFTYVTDLLKECVDDFYKDKAEFYDILSDKDKKLVDDRRLYDVVNDISTEFRNNILDDVYYTDKVGSVRYRSNKYIKKLGDSFVFTLNNSNKLCADLNLVFNEHKFAITDDELDGVKTFDEVFEIVKKKVRDSEFVFYNPAYNKAMGNFKESDYVWAREYLENEILGELFEVVFSKNRCKFKDSWWLTAGVGLKIERKGAYMTGFYEFTIFQQMFCGCAYAPQGLTQNTRLMFGKLD